MSSFVALAPPPSRSMSNVSITAGNSVNKRDIRAFLKILVKETSLEITEHEVFKGIRLNYNILVNLLTQNSLEITPASITHLYLLLSSTQNTSSSTVLASMQSCYANDHIVYALMNAVDATAIKTLMNNNGKISNCADEAINERLKEVSARDLLIN